MIAQIIPYMNSFFTLGHVSIEGDRIDPEFLESFGAFETAYNPETYKTSIKTNVSNLVLEEGFEKVIEPRNAWVTARSVDDFEIKEDDALIPTSRPINVLDNLYYRFDLEYSVSTPEAPGGQIGPFIFKIDRPDIGLEYFKGLKDFVFEESRYNVLPNTTDIVYDAQTDSFEVGKGSALFYTQGQPNIFGLGNRAPTQRSFLGVNLGTKPARQS